MKLPLCHRVVRPRPPRIRDGDEQRCDALPGARTLHRGGAAAGTSLQDPAKDSWARPPTHGAFALKKLTGIPSFHSMSIHSMYIHSRCWNKRPRSSRGLWDMTTHTRYVCSPRVVSIQATGIPSFHSHSILHSQHVYSQPLLESRGLSGTTTHTRCVCSAHVVFIQGTCIPTKRASDALETAVLLLWKAGRTAAMRALCQRNQRL